MSPCGGRRAEWESIANTAKPSTVAILKWHKTCLPTCLKSCTESNLACAYTQKQMPFCSPVETGKERVTAEANVKYSNIEFGICQECTCLHYPLTVECHRASAGEGEGEESMEISAVLLENH